VYARVAKFEGADPANVDANVANVRAQIEAGMASPPPGLEGVKEAWMLIDRETGAGMSITLYENEEDLKRGDTALNAMSPATGDGQRTTVEVYELAVRGQRG
jgi:hypothetical protein